jgi:hypothetical protein
MKPLNAVVVFNEHERKRNHVAAIQTMLLQQIGIVEKIMENNSEYVVSPYCYNACAGLITQLRLQAFAAFMDHGGCAPMIPDGVEAPQIRIMHGE